MSDRIYEKLLEQMEGVNEGVEKENKISEELRWEVSSKIQGLINMDSEQRFQDAIREIVLDLVKEGFEREDVVEYLTSQIQNLEESKKVAFEAVIKEMKLKEEETIDFEILFGDLLPEIQQDYLDFIGVASPEEGNLEYAPIAVVSSSAVEQEEGDPSAEYSRPEEEPIESKETDEGKVNEQGTPFTCPKCGEEFEVYGEEEAKCPECGHVVVEGKVCADNDSEDTKIKKLTEKDKLDKIKKEKAAKTKKDKEKKKADLKVKREKEAEEIAAKKEKAAKAKKESKVNERDDDKEAPVKLDVSKDVKDLMNQAKSALDSGDYKAAADHIEKLATIQEIVPDDALPDFPEESVEEPVEEPEEPVEEPVDEPVEEDVVVEDEVKEEAVDEEKLDEVKVLKDYNDNELESLMAKLQQCPKDIDMSETVAKVQAEIDRRVEVDKKD